ncbi:MAG: DUF4145 domain-containing protein [Candidatus Electrothrix sp. AR3]|nr:DUF4145 domain-containing protein [Candidatus Electrothrix sp. AR3]
MDSCPHCAKSIHFKEEDACVLANEDIFSSTKSQIDGFEISSGFCPSCKGLIVMYKQGVYKSTPYNKYLETVLNTEVLYPKNFSKSLPKEVPDTFKNDFMEANAVLSLSPKASAAISRRSLQNILREHFKIKKSTLASEIDNFLKLDGIPSYLSEAVDAIRNVGNFAAHPSKDISTGEIVEVENGEAEWLLDVLEYNGPIF